MIRAVCAGAGAVTCPEDTRPQSKQPSTKHLTRVWAYLPLLPSEALANLN
jgi:hypothetical protein